MLELSRRGVDPAYLQRVSPILTANSGNAGHWAQLAAQLRQMGNYAAADLVYQTAFQIHGTSALLWNNYGILLRDWNKLAEALGAFERAIDLDVTYARPRENKAQVLEKLHRFADARVFYQAALRLDPGNARITSNIGACLLGENESAQAERWFEKALDLDPRHGDALFNLATLRLQRGDIHSARHLVDRLSDLLPDDPEVRALQARLLNGERKPIEVTMPAAASLDRSGLSPAMQRLCDELTGNPRSIFISYAWADPATKRFAARLCRDLKARSFQVILDQEQGLEVHEILVLLGHCRNVIVLNDKHYAESCLLGQVPITDPTSPYPSFAVPAHDTNVERYVSEVFKISAVAWEIARQLKDAGIRQAAETAIEFARPDAFKKVPNLRLFMEGWRVDEIQMIFHNIKRYRSISMLYLGGEHCLAGFPLFDFSRKEHYPIAFEGLVEVLGLSQKLAVDQGPVHFVKPDWKNYRWPSSSIVRAKMWKVTEKDMMVWRPSVTPSGEVAAIVNLFKAWDPI